MPKAVKIILVILAALAVLGGLGFTALLFLFNGAARIADVDNYEEITRSSYTITLPKGMREGEATMSGSSMTVLDCYVNNKVGIVVASQVLDKDTRKIAQRLDLYTLMKQLSGPRDSNGKEIEMQKRGDMIYGEYTNTQDGKTIMVVDAIFLSETSLYEVEVHCDPEDYDEYKTYIFTWLDSFTPSY